MLTVELYKTKTSKWKGRAIKLRKPWITWSYDSVVDIMIEWDLKWEKINMATLGTAQILAYRDFVLAVIK